MNRSCPDITRREFLAGSAAVAGLSVSANLAALAQTPDAAVDQKALIAITLDFEMSRNFPTWEDTHWDYEKGNLDEATKRYALEACRRVKRRGAVIHGFVVGRVFEQENVDWLREIVDMGHPLGNHTYDHVNVTATRPEDIQFRFHRAPWLMRDRAPREVIEDNIRLTTLAMKERLGIRPNGFRTPGGFNEGLNHRPDIQKMLLGLGFTWVSSRYPAHEIGEPGKPVGEPVFQSILAAQKTAQPYRYPSGLIEVPMNPISDITAFRGGRWKLDDFIEATRRSVAWAIEHGTVFDFLAHPSALGIRDPKFRTIDMICDMVDQASDRAQIVDLSTIARRAAAHPRS